VAGLEVDGAAFVLEGAFEDEEAFLGDGEAVFFEEIRIKDGVGDAGFVLQTDEDDAFGGAGALAADDEAGDADGLEVGDAR